MGLVVLCRVGYDRGNSAPQLLLKIVLVSKMMESIRSREGAKLAKILEFFAPSRALREFTILLTRKIDRSLTKFGGYFGVVPRVHRPILLNFANFGKFAVTFLNRLRHDIRGRLMWRLCGVFKRVLTQMNTPPSIYLALPFYAR